MNIKIFKESISIKNNFGYKIKYDSYFLSFIFIFIIIIFLSSFFILISNYINALILYSIFSMTLTSIFTFLVFKMNFSKNEFSLFKNTTNTETIEFLKKYLYLNNFKVTFTENKNVIIAKKQYKEFFYKPEILILFVCIDKVILVNVQDLNKYKVFSSNNFKKLKNKIIYDLEFKLSNF